jgi:hypothetical protein
VTEQENKVEAKVAVEMAAEAEAPNLCKTKKIEPALCEV